MDNGKSGVVHFSVGKNAGALLTTVAREHLMAGDIDKAVRTFTDSLQGIPEKLYLEILVGRVVLEVDGQEMVAVARDEAKHGEFPEVLNWNEICRRWHKNVCSDTRDYYIGIKRLLNEVIMAERNEYMVIGIADLIRFKATGDTKIIDKQLDKSGLIGNLFDMANRIIEFRNYCDKKLRTAKWLYEKYPTEVFADYTSVPEALFYLTDIANEVLSGKSVTGRATEDAVDDYLKAELEIIEATNNGIEPANILDGYNAGWLAPNGLFYGLNGTISNMLHNSIADALQTAGIIPKEEQQLDYWLEKNGWARVHGRWVLYGGYSMHRISGGIDVPITQEQISALVAYGQSCHSGILELGYYKEAVTAVRLDLLGPEGLRKYFDL